MSRNECPACSSNFKVFKYKTDGFTINKCTECYTLFVENLPSLDELLDQYRKSDYYKLPFDSEERITFENRRRVKIINGFKTSGSVLDIGCAKGSLLDELKTYDYKTFGIEMSSANVELCKSKGHNVHLGDLDSFYEANKGKKFDIISCLDVLEHVHKPREFLLIIKSLLKDDGLLIISTPNFSGIISKLLGERDPYIIPPEHLNFFTKKGLVTLFKQTGFRVKRLNTFGFITENGLNRTIIKYFPKYLHKFSFLLKPSINLSIKFLNYFNQGLELEYYLTHDFKE